MTTVAGLLRKVTSREEAIEILRPLKKKELLELGKILKITLNSGATVAVMKDRIMRRMIGNELDREIILTC